MSWKDIFIAIQKGIVPSKKELVDGTTPVGNANKLGGKSASEYALAEQIKNNSIWTQLTIGFDLNNALGKYRTHSGAITTTLLNLPPTSLQISGCEILVDWLPANDTNIYGIQKVILSYNGKKEIWVRHKTGANSFGEWEELATTADLANYLPLSGGRIDQGQSIRYRLANGGLSAIGSWFENTDGSDAGGVCAIGHNGVFEGLYIAVSPYHYDTSQGLYVTAHSIAWKNCELVHGGNIDRYAMRPRGVTPSASLDTVKENGTYYVNPNSTNLPNEQCYGEMLVIQNEDTFGQLYISHSNIVNGLMYRGGTNTNGFYPWRTVLDTGNSSAVKIQSSAPSDTSALWVW